MTSERSRLRSQNWAIAEIPGLSLTDQTQLQAQGIQTTLQLLQRTQSTGALQALAAQLQIPPRFVKKWAVLADLARVPSVGCQYAGLLLHVGIMSVQQLAQASAPQLQKQMIRLHVTMLRTTAQCPDVGQVTQWIADAKQLFRWE